MSAGSFIKQNFALVAGLAVPVIMMAFFFIAAALPQTVADPPKYDMVFSVQNYNGAALPITVNLIVRDGVLKAQYVRLNPPNSYNAWKRLYVFEAKTQKVRELPLPVPKDVNDIKDTREDIVEAAQGLKLDPTGTSPDGYEFSSEGYSHGVPFLDLFGSGGYRNEPCLRKESTCVRLSPQNVPHYYGYGGTQFIGWVKK